MAEKGKMSGLGSPDYAARKAGHKAYANIHQGDQICRTGGVDAVQPPRLREITYYKSMHICIRIHIGNGVDNIVEECFALSI
jgi:hypothetical protein